MDEHTLRVLEFDKVLARCCLATVMALTVLVAGCGPASVGFTFDNRTDTALCQYPSPQDAAGARCLTELEPRGETGSGADCDNDRNRPITVIITIKQDGSEIYNRTASCGDWHDAGGRFVIGDEFVVTDSLQDETPQ